MIDWPGQIARGRRLAEALLWLGSAVIVALVMAMGTALALWLPPMQGRDAPESPVMVIDLTTLPPAPALAEQPELAPPAPPPEPTAKPEPQSKPEPPPEPKPAPEPDPAPRPDPAPVAKPDPAPIKAEPAPPSQAAPTKPDKPAAKPKAAKPQASAKAKPPKAAKPGAAKPGAAKPGATKPKAAKPGAAAPQPAKPAQVGGAAPARGTASPDALTAWKRKVATQLDRHLRRKSFGARPAKLTATLRIDGKGSIIAVSLARSSGDAALDGRVTAALAAKGAVAAPPDGQPATLTVPVALR